MPLSRVTSATREIANKYAPVLMSTDLWLAVS